MQQAGTGDDDIKLVAHVPDDPAGMFNTSLARYIEGDVFKVRGAPALLQFGKSIGPVWIPSCGNDADAGFGFQNGLAQRQSKSASGALY